MATVARPPTAPVKCICDMLGGTPLTEIRFNRAPANVIKDDTDRALVLNVAHVMMAMKSGETEPLSWHVEDEDDADKGLINVLVKYPLYTAFTARQLTVIGLVNEWRIREVWVQPEADATYICAAVLKSSEAPDPVVQDIVILRRLCDGESTSASAGGRKRSRK